MQIYSLQAITFFQAVCFTFDHVTGLLPEIAPDASCLIVVCAAQDFTWFCHWPH